MQIIMNSRIGNCGLSITAEANCSLALGEAAMKQIVFHDSASFAFREKSGFKRDSVYSDALAAHCKAIVEAKLKAIGFSNVEIKTSAYEKPSDFSRFEKQMKSLGFDSAWIAEAWKASSKGKEEAAETPEDSEANPSLS